eukprot:RCo052997
MLLSLISSTLATVTTFAPWCLPTSADVLWLVPPPAVNCKVARAERHCPVNVLLSCFALLTVALVWVVGHLLQCFMLASVVFPLLVNHNAFCFFVFLVACFQTTMHCANPRMLFPFNSGDSLSHPEKK